MGPVVKVALHGVPQTDALLDPIRGVAHELASGFPDALRCRVELEKVDDLMEAHVELLLPQRQIIVSGADASAEAALRKALSRLHS